MCASASRAKVQGGTAGGLFLPQARKLILLTRRRGANATHTQMGRPMSQAGLQASPCRLPGLSPDPLRGTWHHSHIPNTANRCQRPRQLRALHSPKSFHEPPYEDWFWRFGHRRRRPEMCSAVRSSTTPPPRSWPDGAFIEPNVSELEQRGAAMGKITVMAMMILPARLAWQGGDAYGTSHPRGQRSISCRIEIIKEYAVFSQGLVPLPDGGRGRAGAGAGTSSTQIVVRARGQSGTLRSSSPGPGPRRPFSRPATRG